MNSSFSKGTLQPLQTEGVHNLSALSPARPLDPDAANNKRYITERVQLPYIRGKGRRGDSDKIMSKKLRPRTSSQSFPFYSATCATFNAANVKVSRIQVMRGLVWNPAVSTLIVKVKFTLGSICLFVVYLSTLSVV
jgi:hypothetical protein